MTREELIQITHRLGYDYVWKDIWGKWVMGSYHPHLIDLNSSNVHWWLYGGVAVLTNVEFEGTLHESLLFYGDTLCQNKEEEAKEVESRG